MATIYKGVPVFDIAPDFSAMQSGLLDDTTFDRRAHGVGTPWKITAGPRRTIQYPFTLEGRERIADFRRFVADRAGRLRGFWLPIYSLDYRIVSVDGDEVTVERVGLTGAVESSQFKHLIVLSGGSMQIAEIADCETDGETEVITLTEAIDPVDDDRALCGGLLMARCADDELAYQFLGLDCATTAVKFVELPTEYETQHEGSAPIYLYLIERGANVARLAGWGVDVVAGGQTWQASDITHGSITSGIEFVPEGVDVTAATDSANHPFRYFLHRNSSEAMMITIYEVDGDDLPSVLPSPIYRGRAGAPQFGARGEIKVRVSSILRIAEQEIPRLRVQRWCNHRLYDDFCGLNEGDFSTAGTLTAVSEAPPYIEAAAFGAKATAEDDPNWFALGKVTIGSETRFCVGQNGNRLYLNAAFASAQAGQQATARAGCNRLINTCQTKFNNVGNFFGFPYVPSKSPQFQALETPKASGGKKA